MVMVTKMCARVVVGCGDEVRRAGIAEQAVVKVAKNINLEVFQKCFLCHIAGVPRCDSVR